MPWNLLFLIFFLNFILYEFHCIYVYIRYVVRDLLIFLTRWAQIIWAHKSSYKYPFRGSGFIFLHSLSDIYHLIVNIQVSSSKRLGGYKILYCFLFYSSSIGINLGISRSKVIINFLDLKCFLISNVFAMNRSRSLGSFCIHLIDLGLGNKVIHNSL